MEEQAAEGFSPLQVCKLEPNITSVPDPIVIIAGYFMATIALLNILVSTQSHHHHC